MFSALVAIKTIVNSSSFNPPLRLGRVRWQQAGQALVQLKQEGDALGGFDVDGVLWLDDLCFVAGDEAKELDIFVQVGELELDILPRGEAMDPKPRKVADDDDLRQMSLRWRRRPRCG